MRRRDGQTRRGMEWGGVGVDVCVCLWKRCVCAAVVVVCLRVVCESAFVCVCFVFVCAAA